MRYYIAHLCDIIYIISYLEERVKPPPPFYYLILIVFGFFSSGTIFSRSITSIPSFNSAPFTTTSSANVNDLVNCLLDIPLWIVSFSSLSLLWIDLIVNWPSATDTSISFLLKPASAISMFQLKSSILLML